MVHLSLPLLDNLDNESGNSSLPNCDPSQSIYDTRSCVKDFLFCSDDNPCPSKIPCIDRVCQCLPNTHSYITLTPPPVRMYTIGCNFDTKRQYDGCRDYEYGVNNQTCLLNYCSSEVPCYAGTCDNSRNVCVNTNTTTKYKPLPTSANPIITLGDDPFGTNKQGMSPVLIIIMAAGGVVALALIGCIIRTTSSWTKQTVAWAKGEKISERTEGESGEYTEGKEQDSKMMDTDSISGPVALFTTNTPAKFTGSHHMPSPQIHPVSDSISIFSSPSPLPSPRVMPYSQPNYQVSNSSLLNPFGRGAGIDTNSSVTIELSDRSLTPTKSYESLTASERSRPFAPEARGMETRAVTPEGVVSRSATAGTAGTAPYYPRSSRPQSPLSRDLGYERPGSNLHKSMSMQQLGSRPAPPPPRPGLHQALSGPIRLPSVPAIAITNTSHPRPATVIMTQADMQGPYLSLDSLIERTSININNDNQASSESSESSEPEIVAAESTSPTERSSFVFQTGAERHPSLSVVPPQHMLRHSSSVPQLFVSPPPSSTSIISQQSPPSSP